MLRNRNCNPSLVSYVSLLVAPGGEQSVYPALQLWRGTRLEETAVMRTASQRLKETRLGFMMTLGSRPFVIFRE